MRRQRLTRKAQSRSSVHFTKDATPHYKTYQEFILTLTPSLYPFSTAHLRRTGAIDPYRTPPRSRNTFCLYPESEVPETGGWTSRMVVLKRSMKRRLHEHLRAELGLEHQDLNKEDLLEPLPDDYYDPQKRQAKRRRVEKIGTDYLRRGQVPIFLSTRLRGHFTGDWRNPWRGVQSGRHQGDSGGSNFVQDSVAVRNTRSENRQRCSSERVAVAHKAPTPDQDTDHPREARERPQERVQRPDATRNKHILQGEAKERGRVSPLVRSTSRGFDMTSEKSTAHPPQRGSQSPTPSNWLRRRDRDIGRRTSSDIVGRDGSPTPARGNHGAFSSRRTLDLRVASPRAPVATRSSPGMARTYPLGGNWKSSASASMAISSPARQTPIVFKQPIEDRPKLRGDISASAHCAQHKEPLRPVSTEKGYEGNKPSGLRAISGRSGHTEFISTPSSYNLRVPGSEMESPVSRQQTAQGSPLATEGVHASSQLEHSQAAEGEDQERIKTSHISRKDIQHSSERCPNAPSSATGGPVKTKANQRNPDHTVPDHLNNDAQNPLAPGSTNSFRYKRLGGPRRAVLGRKSKPRLMTFDSPITRESDRTISRNEKGESDVSRVAISNVDDSAQSPRGNVYDVLGENEAMADGPRGEEQRESLGSSRQSLYSTQAAMMLAQLEFQEGTFPSPSFSSQTPRPPIDCQGQSPNEAPRGNIGSPAPVITPFHAFNANLDKTHVDSDVSGPPISTQDLFLEASPFAFSTVKKKPVAPKRSSLRFTVLSNSEEQHEGDIRKTPTPSAERVPLKDRNSLVSFRAASEKDSQKSPQSSPIRRSTTVELSPGAFDGDLSFADRFLRNLDGPS